MRGVKGTERRHGTHSCYAATGCRCVGCTKAHALYCKVRKLDVVRGIKYTRPGSGTARRLQALAVIGWSGQEIAASLGCSRSRVDQLRRATSTVVFAITADRVAGVYRALSMTPGPSARARCLALAAGWAPPLAWDDIDTDARPNLGEPSRGFDLDEWARLVRYGTNPTAAAARCGVTVSAVEQSARRHARPDILALLRRAA